MKKLLFIIGVLFFVNNIFAQITEQELLKTSKFLLTKYLKNPQSYKEIHYNITKHYLYDSLSEEISSKNVSLISYTKMLWDLKKELGDLNNQRIEELKLNSKKIDLNNNKTTSIQNNILYYKNLIDSCDKSLSFLSDTIKRKEKLSSFGIYVTYSAIFIGGLFMPTGLALMTSISTPLLTIQTSVSNYGKNAFLGKKYKSLKDEYYSLIDLKNSYNKNIELYEYQFSQESLTWKELYDLKRDKEEYFIHIIKELNQNISSVTNRIEELTKEIESLKVQISNTNKKQVRRYNVGISFYATNKYGGIVKCQYHISYDSFGHIIKDWSDDDEDGVFNNVFHLTH